jgi:hypothetical protein
MKPKPIHRLPAPLEAALQRLKLTAREACERTVESLGLAALAALSALQRDALLSAQYELNRKSAVFVLHFNDAYDERMLRELGGRGLERSGHGEDSGATTLMAREPRPTSWDALSLVEDREVELQIRSDRFAMEVAAACEWELRELDGYVASLLADSGSEPTSQALRNPLRPELVGHALVRAVEAVSEQLDIRQRLLTELSRSLAALLRPAYAAIVADFRKTGITPIGLQVRQRAGAGGSTAYGAPHSVHSNFGGSADSRAASLGTDSARAALQAAARGGGFAPSTRSGQASGSGHGQPSGYNGGANGGGGGFGTPLGSVDPALMTLLRRLAYAEPMLPSGVGGLSGPGSRSGLTGHGAGSGGGEFAGASGHGGEFYDGGSAPLPNLIHLHRDELRQASRGALDHMVIDVIGFLFDQILADPKVPPQMARLIARLQLPVLRAALGDSTFFSSRRHPVRRFVNRIASLGAAFEDFDEESARDFLAKVKALITEVVEGDFDQIEVYERKLKVLENYVAEQAQSGPAAEAARLLAEKEDELRLRQLYAERLSSELRDLTGPAFVREFIARTWSQVLLRASDVKTAEGGNNGPLVQKFRRTARELALSVQPKTTPAHRKTFLAELPKLMQELTEGMNLIGWPESERRAFFGQLMPAHADSLKAPPARTLDLNLMAKRVEGALEGAPSREELKALPAVPLPVLSDAVVLPVLSAEEAAQVGWVGEQQVDWNGEVDIDLASLSDAGELAAAQGASVNPVAPGLPAMTDAAEPVQGRELADAVQIGFAYQMQLHDRWQKVRLAHVSAARSFFLFTHGTRQRQSVSLTHRMLQKLCESGRFRAYEQATLIERATERARRQLAQLAPARV